MPASSPDLFDPDARSHWIRLRTLVVLRWIAILGQLVAISVAQFVFELDFEIGLCFAAVAASVLSNLLAVFAFPESKRLSEREVVTMLLFDISQLCFLLYLTGGLNNPFALLVLAPVTISASSLKLRSTVFLGATAFFLVTLIAFNNVPLQTFDGELIEMPSTLLFGAWTALAIGLAFIAAYAHRVSSEVNAMSEALLATQMALLREQKLTDLGGVVAAAAHELGTPLATIKLVSTELNSELTDPDHKADAVLIREQADRCRDILRSMGRAGKDDKQMKRAPIDVVIREAAEPHTNRGKRVVFSTAPTEGGDSQQPMIVRQPEIIHGLRNLMQNAVDFSETSVWIDANWSRETVNVRISDDGDGYPLHVIGRLGDPFLRSRKGEGELDKRPEYEGMGLGLFIAKTLLERSGATLHFYNGSDPFLDTDERPERSGAIVDVTWPRESIVTRDESAMGGLGFNQPIET